MDGGMSKINFETECACGAPLMGEVKKPTRYEHSIKKITCGDCGTRYLIKLERDKGIKDRRVFITNCYLLELSPQCRRAITKNPIMKAKVIAEKMGYETKPDNSLIETEMD
jgi:predicted metal-binding protein